MKLVVICALFAAMFITGSAWASAYTVDATPTLDSAGKKLTLEFSFYKDGQKASPFESLDSQAFADCSKYVVIEVQISDSDNNIIIEEIESTTQSYYKDKLIGEFDLSGKPLETGDYVISIGDTDGSSAFYALTEDEQNALFQKYGDAFENLFSEFTLYTPGTINGGRPVHIARDDSSGSSGGGCDAGFGLFGLLLAGLAVSKRRA
jgi:hypothetical protein